MAQIANQAEQLSNGTEPTATGASEAGAAPAPRDGH